MKEIYKQSQINNHAAMSLVNNAIKKAEEINVDICAPSSGSFHESCRRYTGGTDHAFGCVQCRSW